MFFTAVTVTLEDHLIEVGFIQKVDTFLVKVKFLAGRTINRMLAIYLNAGHAAILTTCLVVILTRF